MLKGDRHHIWSKHCTLCGCGCVCVCVRACVRACVCACVRASDAGGTVCLCKQAACYFLAPVPLETLEALSETPRQHFEVASKRKGCEVDWCV